MARNAIQLQKGLSLCELNASYGSEEKCAAAIFKWRWPDGVRVPGLRQPRLRYRRCARAISLPRLPEADLAQIRHYFCAHAAAVRQMVPGHVFARAVEELGLDIELARQPGVRPDTAALMRHKLMSVMFEREASRKLTVASRWTMPCSVARKASWMAANVGVRGPTRPLSSWPSRPAMTGGRCVCCCMS